ncbi:MULTISPECIES: hypothetical protein [Brucella/Ochrobactrum group]|jgi:hypothetical protein|uniref:Uncharacterized protein n=1 Tax=Brucella pseudintermedia TaxID=370111 RepID=A0ABY5UE72_9HYPH|nr:MULTISPECIES: hypothetical protein [Brucella/Ochrobactrum group]KAB2685362.1 hypothetical protein F9K78_01215 [Brucella pseudintermedia]MCO7725685.1 hypothetical protein [Brucella intermedia]NKE76773.1 hypothetical protein [Ochrobactrum sp. MC-1LL]TWG98879.1 hypothetical protein L614_000400002340 [Ochrobactrum sp. J50]UWL61171.1 hypothetical protein NIK97_05300 [Brucella pseudintermedia]
MPKAITELKIAMSKALHNLAQSGDASNNNVIKYLRKNHSDLISESKLQLEEIAFRRILNEIVSRNANVFSNSQTDIFGQDQGLKSLYSIKVDGERKRVPIENIKITTIIEDLEEKEARRAKKNKNEKLIESLKALLAHSGSNDITYGDALKAYMDNSV